MKHITTRKIENVDVKHITISNVEDHSSDGSKAFTTANDEGVVHIIDQRWSASIDDQVDSFNALSQIKDPITQIT